MSLWGYLSERKSFRAPTSNGRRMSNGRNRSISETLEDVAEEMLGSNGAGYTPDGSNPDVSGSPGSALSDPAGSPSVRIMSKWFAHRTKSLDVPGRQSPEDPPRAGAFSRRMGFSQSLRVRHSSAPFSSSSPKEQAHDNDQKNGLSSSCEPDVWLPRHSSVERKVLPSPRIILYPFLPVISEH